MMPKSQFRGKLLNRFFNLCLYDLFFQHEQENLFLVLIYDPASILFIIIQAGSLTSLILSFYARK
ncbi:MAG: hypothetical protein C4308_10070 [Chitinophagaceae bacterium]